MLRNFDGVTIQPQGAKEGLDLNRNFPVAWRQENEQPGAGPYPVSEPESRNMVDFIVRHPNLTGVVTFHTYSGVLLRPYDDRPDDEFPPEDLWTYKKIGDQGTSMTGYPNLSCYHDFRYHPKQVTTGAFDTWMYDHLGRLLLDGGTLEPDAPGGDQGLQVHRMVPRPPAGGRSQTDEMERSKCWAEKATWTGTPSTTRSWARWNWAAGTRLNYLGQPAVGIPRKGNQGFPRLDHLARLDLAETGAALDGRSKPSAKGAFRVRLVVENTGWLPTYVTKKAVEKKVSRGVICEIELPEGATPAIGQAAPGTGATGRARL